MEIKFYLREGAIYYRYRAQSTEIKYPDLKIMLETEKENEKKLWMKTISKIAKIGVNNLSLIDLKNGKLNTNGLTRNKELFIDETLLSKIKLIKEGEFSEKQGAPTLKIIGEVKGITGALVKKVSSPKAITPTNLTENYLLKTFIEQTGTQSPLSYIDGICHFTVKYLPFYYFIYLIQQSDKDFDKSKLKEEIYKIKNDCKVGKTYLLERLKSDNTFIPEKLTGKDEALKREILETFNNKKTTVEDILEENIDIQLKMILNIQDEERITNLIIPLLKKYLEKYYNKLRNF